MAQTRGNREALIPASRSGDVNTPAVHKAVMTVIERRLAQRAAVHPSICWSTFLRIADPYPMRIVENRYAVCLTHVEFSADLALSGPWAAIQGGMAGSKKSGRHNANGPLESAQGRPISHAKRP